MYYRVSVQHRLECSQLLVVEVGFIGLTSSGRCMGGGGSLSSVINKQCNVTGIQYTHI